MVQIWGLFSNKKHLIPVDFLDKAAVFKATQRGFFRIFDLNYTKYLKDNT